MKKCRAGHSLTKQNAYRRPDGYIECRTCRSKAYNHGLANRGTLTFTAILAAKSRFSGYVKRRGPKHCWLWIGAGDVYGTFRVGFHSVPAHRVALALKLRRLVIGLACHSCDTPRCCNPKHLHEGTTQSNIKERDERGRTAKGQRHAAVLYPETFALRGEDGPNAKLSNQDAREIRALAAIGTSRAILSRRFKVSLVQIGNIINKKCFRQI